MVRFYNQRGTAEQWIKEGKNAVKWTRLFCHDFVDNQVRRQLFVLACNLGNFLRQAVLPHAAHRACAKHAEVTVPSLDDWERDWQVNLQCSVQPELLPMHFRSALPDVDMQTYENCELSDSRFGFYGKGLLHGPRTE